MRRLGSAYAQRTGLARSLYLVIKRRSLRARSVTEMKMPRQEVSLYLGEPELHLIEPRSVGGGVMQIDVRMRLEEGHNLRRLMGRQVIGDDVDHAIVRLRGHDLL